MFSVFFLPGYLSQPLHQVAGDLFNSLAFNLAYIVQVAPQVLLLLYLIVRNSGGWPPREAEGGQPQSTAAEAVRASNPGEPVAAASEAVASPTGSARPGTSLGDYGIIRLSQTSLVRALFAFAAIYAVLVPLLFALSRLSGILPAPLADHVTWRLTNLPLLPLVLATCLLTGYSEELYFRAYLLTEFRRLGVAPALAVGASTLLFALGHLYEGLSGFLGTAAIGVVLSLFFLRRRDLHSIALAHGLYNFVTLLLARLALPF